MTFDLIIRNGRLADATGEKAGDIAVTAGRIAAVGPALGSGTAASTEIDAAGRYVMPGGVDSHVHLGQLSSKGDMTADDFWTGSRSAVFGGTTTVVPFAAQHRGMSITEVVDNAMERAAAEMTVDYGMHLIITDWQDPAPAEFATAAGAGLTAVKIYLTYDRLKVPGSRAIELMQAARAAGVPVMVHAEDDAIVGWGRDERVAAGRLGADSHAYSHSRGAEWSGVAQAIALAEAAAASLYLAHISTPQAIDLVLAARQRGVDVVAETCPHYLLLDESAYLDPIETAAPFMCSPPLRGPAERAGLIEQLGSGAIDIVSSDHSPYTMNQKLPTGPATAFTEVANGLPGVELRLSLLYTAAVADGPLTISDFVRLVATNPAKTCGLYPRKGSLEVGADADILVWDDAVWTVGEADLHDNVGYTPYEGMQLQGQPVIVVSRGEAIVGPETDGTRRGRGAFVTRT
jgi:dihydropyrimidinase